MAVTCGGGVEGTSGEQARMAAFWKADTKRCCDVGTKRRQSILWDILRHNQHEGLDFGFRFEGEGIASAEELLEHFEGRELGMELQPGFGLDFGAFLLAISIG